MGEKHIDRSERTIKTYTFKKGNVTLEYSLNIESKDDLNDFRELLVAAQNVMDSDIEELQRKEGS